MAFFILIGNISQWEAFRQILAAFLTGHEFLVAIFASQVISNVPAAVLLSGFTDNAAALLLGTDIGGLGRSLPLWPVSFPMASSSALIHGSRVIS